jgi:hypothetical protein
MSKLSTASETLPCDGSAALKLQCSTTLTSDSAAYPYPNFAPSEDRVHLLNIFKDPTFPSASGKTEAAAIPVNVDSFESASLVEKYTLNAQNFTDMLTSYPNVKEEVVARYLGFFPSKKKACEQLDKAILYRSTTSVINFSDVEAPMQTDFFQYHGTAKDNACVAYFALDNHDKNNRVASIETYIKAMIYAIEKEAQRSGKNELMKTCLLIDRRKATSKNQDLELIKEVLDVLVCLYPNSMPSVLVCPCNLATRIFFGIVKPFLDKKTAETAKLVKGMKEIEEYVDKSELKEGFES